MVEMSIVYTGEKHCELKHGPSGTEIQTDAPKDNNGRGEAFSPTDLIGASLASCILTTMAIAGERDGLDLRGMSAKVTKHMQLDPRRIAKLPIEVVMPKGLSPSDRRRLEIMAHACPVAKSIHPDIQAPITFIYID